MKCTICSIDFNDGVQCGSCKKHFDFGCAQITEVGWRKLGSDRRATWKCGCCRGHSPTPSSATCNLETVSLEMVLKEIQGIKKQLAQLTQLPGLIEDVKSIKQELKDVKTSTEFTINKIDDFTTRVADVEARLIPLEKLGGKVDNIQSMVDAMKSQLSIDDQRSRLNNVEIKGVPFKKDENLFSIVDSISNKVNYKFPKTQINYVYRIPILNSKEKSIIVSFINRYVKEEFVAAARAAKNLTASDIGYKETQRVFVNDHLNAESKKLLNKVKDIAKEKGIQYVWVRFGKIHVRKNDTSGVFVVLKESDLNKLS